MVQYPSDTHYKAEDIPKPKYRAMPKKEHTDKLAAFDFTNSWRKKSFQSTHSPGGTRLSSRRNSMWSLGRKSVGRKSMGSESDVDPSEGMTGEDTSRQRHVVGETLGPAMTTQTEQEGDDDVGNGKKLQSVVWPGYF